MQETPSSGTISPKLEKIANLARQGPTMGFTTLAHHIDEAWLREAYRRTRKDGAPGIDGETASDYAEQLDDRLTALLNAAKSGRYRAPAVRRVQLPKEDGSSRPLGIPTFEDKVLQRAVMMVLEAIYEQDFLDCSYGFRPGRSAHDALDAFHSAATRLAGGWVVELDIQQYFESIDHGHLRDMLNQRIRDGVVTRLLGKWLKAGVLEEGVVRRRERGTPQGGVISPLLANLYLHHVLDTWFEQEVRPRLRGKASLFRYADDAVLLFETEDDARRVMEVLPKRFGKYGLTLHPAKTRLVPFKRPDRLRGRGDSNGDGPCGPKTFDFLGFTIHWGKSLAGRWVVKTRTASSRFRRALKRLSDWCQRNRHHPLALQRRRLNQQLRGHYGYYGRIGNRNQLWVFHRRAIRAWKRALARRSQRGLSWHAMYRLVERFPLLTPAQARLA